MDARAYQVLRRTWRDLSIDDVRHHGAGCAGLCAGSSGPGGSAAAVRHADGRTTRTIFLPALFLACLGHGDRGIRSGGSRYAPERSACDRRGDWLLTKEVRRKGDWSVKRPNTEPSGWYFEFANEFYPDIDDTAMVLLACSTRAHPMRGAQSACDKRAVNWLLDMQAKDGGWAAFDVDNNWDPLSYVPFADHNAMLDPSCPDITGRVLEALCRYGVAPEDPAMQRGVDYLLRTQEQDGSWYGRWGVNYIYGLSRSAGLEGRRRKRPRSLCASRRRMDPLDSECRWRLGRKLRQLRQRIASRRPRALLRKPPGPSWDCWRAAIDEISLQKGIEYLIENQTAEGTWDENSSTGTGFPQVFYLSYHLYRNSFPLLALSSFLKAKARERIGR